MILLFILIKANVIQHSTLHNDFIDVYLNKQHLIHKNKIFQNKFLSAVKNTVKIILNLFYILDNKLCLTIKKNTYIIY